MLLRLPGKAYAGVQERRLHLAVLAFRFGAYIHSELVVFSTSLQYNQHQGLSEALE